MYIYVMAKTVNEMSSQVSIIDIGPQPKLIVRHQLSKSRNVEFRKWIVLSSRMKNTDVLASTL
jgi:hypothetical protein